MELGTNYAKEEQWHCQKIVNSEPITEDCSCNGSMDGMDDEKKSHYSRRPTALYIGEICMSKVIIHCIGEQWH